MVDAPAHAEPKPAYRIALGVEYDGSFFSGWQRQLAPELPTIQGVLEQALGKIANHPVKTICAGRTDKGVHATGQVIHFDCAINRGQKAWTVGTNSLLPDSVRVLWARTVDAEFHARFSAQARRYLYLLYVNDVAPALLVRQLTHVSSELDVDAMQAASRHLLGEHDFSSFRAAGCQSRSPMRCITRLTVSRKNRYVVVDIQANAFLQHMVRNIVGMLLTVGRHEVTADWAAELLARRDRTAGAVTAPANGLYLVEVNYPALWQLPVTAIGPSYLQPYP